MKQGMNRAALLCITSAILCGAEPDALVRQVAGYDFGNDPAAVRELETLTLRTAGTKNAPAMEKLLLAGLGSARTAAAKDAFCRDLAMIGSDSAVPALTTMMDDPNAVELARYALERIPGERATAALRGALARASPSVQTGIVVSLGRRRDQASVPAIAPMLASRDTRMASAAAAALGNIATPPAREALLAAPPAPAVSGALLQIAERSNPETALRIYRRLNSAGESHAVQAAALGALAHLDPGQAAPLLHAALQSGSVRLQGVAVRELARLEGVALAQEIPRVPERARVQIIAALTESGRPEVRPILVEGAASDSQAVRVASLNGLAKLGTAADVAMLAQRAAATTGDEQAAARAALAGIQGSAADAAILQALPAAEPTTKVELIHAAGQRGMASATGVLLAAAADANRAVRLESVRALRETAVPGQVPALLALLVKTSNESERREFERTIGAAIRRSQESRVGEVIDAYQAAREANVRTALLSIMSAVGNADALPLIRQALQDPGADVQRAALNALSGWPTPAPMDDLLSLARSASEPTRRILALRGYIKLVQIPSNRTSAQTAALLKTAMAAATMPNEKRAVLAVAQKVVCPESLELARSAIQDPQVAAEAELAATTLERGLSFVKK